MNHTRIARRLPLVLLLLGIVPLLNAAQRPNILFFAVDDLSDWITPMGYEQAITPNLQRLADSGITFQNAHTAGVYCAPSRTAIFTGRHAATTGCYTYQLHYVTHPEITPLQVAMQQAGYATYGAGKLFHHGKGCIDMRGWDEYYIRDDELKTRGWPLESWTQEHPALPRPYPSSIYNRTDKPTDAQWFLEWGAVKNENEEIMADTMRANWAANKVKQKHDKPFFVGVGIYAPHFPNYVPQKYFDLYDRDALVPPDYLETDLDDLPERMRQIKTDRGKIHRHLENIDAVKDAIHGYLASVTYADAMLGRVLDALDSGPNKDNTVIVFWSDHGYHHGEKFDWGKHTLWERTSNVPLLWAGPGIARGRSANATVSLIDMYPTLMDLVGAPLDPGFDGKSLAGILANPDSARDRDVLLPGMVPEEFAIMNQRWRYIRYRDGEEELYDIQSDPREWHNLANNPEYEDIKKKLAASAPETFAKPGPTKAEYRIVFEGNTFTWVVE